MRAQARAVAAFVPLIAGAAGNEGVREVLAATSPGGRSITAALVLTPVRLPI